jgi:hypothetical protein
MEASYCKPAAAGSMANFNTINVTCQGKIFGREWTRSIPARRLSPRSIAAT